MNRVAASLVGSLLGGGLGFGLLFWLFSYFEREDREWQEWLQQHPDFAEKWGYPVGPGGP